MALSAPRLRPARTPAAVPIPTEEDADLALARDVLAQAAAAPPPAPSDRIAGHGIREQAWRWILQGIDATEAMQLDIGDLHPTVREAADNAAAANPFPAAGGGFGAA